MIVADTDVLIDFLRGTQPMADRVGLELTTSTLHTTAVNSFEFRSGAHSDRQQRAVNELLAALRILPLGSAEAEAAAAVRHALEARGEGIGMADYLIAGICLARRAILLTKNRRHFERVQGLSLSLTSLENL